MAANCLGFLLASVITLPLNKIKPTLFRARGNGTFIKVARNSSESYGLFCSFVTLKLNYTTGSLRLSSLLMPSHMASVCSSKQGRTSWKIFCLFLFLSPEVFVLVGGGQGGCFFFYQLPVNGSLNFNGWGKMLMLQQALIFHGGYWFVCAYWSPVLSNAAPCREKSARILEILPISNMCSGLSCVKEQF